MKILVLSFYYPPDIGPGALRAQSIVEALLEEGTSDLKIDVITAMPNRYNLYRVFAKDLEEKYQFNIKRIKVPFHRNKIFDQVRSFVFFSFKVFNLTKNSKYDIIISTSSRLMTASLGAFIAKRYNSKLYLDIRDLFVDTMKSILEKSIFKYLLPLINSLEKWTFNSASKINIVSEGYSSYFKKNYPSANVTTYTNGIDEFFLNHNFKKNYKNKKTKILYAGNIGDGQGLHKIIPKVAKKFQNIQFKIIGDGSASKLLINNKIIKSLDNVEICNPIPREELIKEYEKADYLFIHLNDFKAFNKVLPSKIFEYAATNKPILAGVSGFAKKFLKEEVPGTLIFSPCDHKEMEKNILKITQKSISFNRSNFFLKYRRKDIMKKVAKDILLLT